MFGSAMILGYSAELPCGYDGTALFGEYGHVSVMSTDCGIPTAEQPVQRWGQRCVGILMLPSVITGSPRAIHAVGGGLVEKPERVKLCLTDGHCYCPSLMGP